MTDPFFEDYCRLQLPEHLRQTDAPDTYPSQRAWEDARAKDIAKHRAECLTVYNQKLAQGWRPEELASGEALEQYVASGAPVRFTDRLSAGVRRDAKLALIELKKRQLRLESLSQGILEAATYSPNPPSEKQARAMIEMAEAACQRYDVLARAEEKVEKSQPQITVFQTIKCVGGRTYKRGVYLITHAEAHMLEGWLANSTAEIARRGHVEAGWTQWPPFEITRLVMDPTQVERPPQQVHALWQSQQHALSQEPKS